EESAPRLLRGNVLCRSPVFPVRRKTKDDPASGLPVKRPNDTAIDASSIRPLGLRKLARAVPHHLFLYRPREATLIRAAARWAGGWESGGEGVHAHGQPSAASSSSGDETTPATSTPARLKRLVVAVPRPPPPVRPGSDGA